MAKDNKIQNNPARTEQAVEVKIETTPVEQVAATVEQATNAEAKTETAQAQINEIIPDEKAKGDRETAKKIAEELKIDKIFENSKGEFFTEYTYAVSSEGGVKANIITHQF